MLETVHWIPAKLSATSAACTSGRFHARDSFNLMSSKLGTSRASSPRASLTLQCPSWSRRRFRRRPCLAVFLCPRPRLQFTIAVTGMIQVRCHRFSCRYVVLTPLTVSVYSSGSVTTSSFDSPAVTSFSLLLGRSSQSPPLDSRDGGVRLSNTPLSDIASLRSVPGPPRKATTSPDYSLAPAIQGDYDARWTSLSVNIASPRPPAGSSADSEAEKWYTHRVC